MIQMRTKAIFPDVNVDTLMTIQSKDNLRLAVDSINSKFKPFKTEHNERVIYSYGVVKFPFGIATRDFVVKRVLLENIAGYDNIALQFSIDHPDYPPVPNAIRAHHRILAAGARKIGPNRTELHMTNEISMGVS